MVPESSDFMMSKAWFNFGVGIWVVVCLKISEAKSRTLCMFFASVAVVKAMGEVFKAGRFSVR